MAKPLTPSRCKVDGCWGGGLLRLFGEMRNGPFFAILKGIVPLNLRNAKKGQVAYLRKGSARSDLFLMGVQILGQVNRRNLMCSSRSIAVLTLLACCALAPISRAS